MESDESIKLMMAEFRKNSQWLIANIDELRKKYNGKYVAILNQQVVDSDINSHTLIDRLRATGKDDRTVLIEYITTDPEWERVYRVEMPK